MRFHLSAFRASIASAALTPLTPVPEPVVRIVGNSIYVPPLNRVVGVAAFGTLIAQAQLAAPSLSQRFAYDIARLPAVANLAFASFPLFDPDWFLQMDTGEPLSANAANSGAANIEKMLVWFADQVPDRGEYGEILTVRCTAATTLVIGAWTACPLTFTQALPVGDYEVVGMAAQSAGAVAARLVPVEGGFRPGCPGQVNLNDPGFPLFRNGNFGTWLRFNYLTPPQVEFLSESADASEVVYLDLRKVGGFPGRSSTVQGGRS